MATPKPYQMQRCEEILGVSKKILFFIKGDEMKVYCSKCGYQVKEESKFCSACGEALDRKKVNTDDKQDELSEEMLIIQASDVMDNDESKHEINEIGIQVADSENSDGVELEEPETNHFKRDTLDEVEQQTSNEMNRNGTELIKQGTEKTLSGIKKEISNAKQSGKIYLYLGWVFIVLSIFFWAILLGTASVIMGYLYREKDEKKGNILIVVGVFTGVMGILVNM